MKSANDKLYKLHNLLYLSSAGIILRHSKSLYINLLSGYQYTFYLQGQLSVHTAPWWNIQSIKLMEKLSQQLYCNVRVLENVENLNQCSSNTLLHIIRFFVTPTLFSIWYGYPPHTVVSSDGTLEKRDFEKVSMLGGKTRKCPFFQGSIW